MSCAIADLLLWSLRRYFHSSRGHDALAAIEGRWADCQAELAWPGVADFLSVVALEREIDLQIESATGHPASADETRVLAAFTIARWDEPAAAAALRFALSDASARAAAGAARRAREILGRSVAEFGAALDRGGALVDARRACGAQTGR